MIPSGVPIVPIPPAQRLGAGFASPNARSITAGRAGSMIVPVFLISLALPLVIDVAGLRLSPYRVILICMFLPCLAALVSGRLGRASAADISVVFTASWCALSFVVVHGLDGVEAAGMVLIETLTPYLLARQFIRTPRQFHAMVRVLVGAVLCMLPFAIIEALTARNLWLGAFDLLAVTYPDVAKPPRLGLDRVQGPFEHPILFGVVCGAALALGVYALKPVGRWLRAGLVFVTASLSLSSGPLAAIGAQTGLMAWDRFFRGWRLRWHALAFLLVIGYVSVDLISTRSPPEVFISLAAFDPATAYNRLLIWEWGWANIAANPWFGLGYEDWERLWFMTDSIDMFWIQRAMSHGVPAGLGFLLSLIFVIAAIAWRTALSAYANACRTGLIICLIGFFIAGMTVHFWNATFVLLMFLLGSGAWLLEDRLAGERFMGRPQPPRPASRSGLLATRARSPGAMEP
ncbi:MAG: O-antigen ligase domain-containing protein [Pseudomonadota bacterium]